ncbi:MAG: hypothetical protein JWP27_814 [Flaviaesturariibacter sp.]|nr:hypothetical protein [Flaviaesturariibacter sp.]
MKKILFSIALLFVTMATFASEPVKTTDIKAPISLVAFHVTSVHLEGTMTSSCGVTWNFTYDCPSDCSFGGTMTNLGTMQTAINNACGTNTTELSFRFPQG